MYQLQKRRKSCCPQGHILQEQITKAKLDSFLTFIGNVDYIKIHCPSSLKCSRCNTNIYADHQPTFATCEPCNFHLCRGCAGDSSPVSSMGYNDDVFASRKRKGRGDQLESNSQMCFNFQHDPNKVDIDLAKRYNNVRPNYALYPRVQYQYYPEPINYGWRFTGSCERSKVEFYEREVENGIVYLDFDFMNGTVRKILKHVGGEGVLFAKGKSLLPDVYQRILQDPMFSDTGFRRRV